MQLRRSLSLVGALSTLSACATGFIDQKPAPKGGDDPLEVASGAGPASEEAFTAFESGQVRPLALSPDGKTLYALNTPDNRVEIFKTGDARLERIGAVRVGLEPVAVAAVSSSELWVVNHLSDSVSIVDVSNPGQAFVKRTLLVGDEPRDIVVAGSTRKRAFITTAHRGQNSGRDPQLTTPGVGRADVWVFDISSQGSSLGGTPVTVINLFTDTPRALAVSGDRKTVFAAGFHTGNRTTTVNERLVTNNGGAPEPTVSIEGVAAPHAGLIVKFRTGPDGQQHWLDETDRIWDAQVNFALPDRDVFAIDANAATPAVTSAISGVGTVLFNMAVNPVNGKVYVSNLESRNEVRFEGHNEAGGGSSVRGHIAESRVTVISGSTASPRHLNKHIDYSVDGSPAEAAKSLAFPTGMVVNGSGRTLLVTAFGSSKLGIFSTSELEADTFVPSTAAQVALSGGGPSGLVLQEDQDLAYVLTRFDNGISVVDVSARKEVSHTTMYNPEPASITNGRRFLYDAQLSSSHGDSACASCHIFGDLDSLAWDLGNPDGSVQNNPGPFAIPILPFFPTKNLHPMKGPMTTQSLRGMANHGPMHWRGDRTGGNDVEESAQPDTGAFDEQAAFKAFNGAFPGLLGRSGELSDAEMQAFTDFILQVTYPPNPIRNLDNSLTAAQQAGKDFYFNHAADGTELPSDTFRNCNGCHTLDPTANAELGEPRPGFFGTDGQSSFENEAQFMKIPHLRNLYQKVGMFGMPNTFRLPIDTVPPSLQFLPAPLNDLSFKGDQVRGFGFTHDGSVDTVFRFLGGNVFAQRPATDQFPNPFGIPPNASGVVLRRQLEAFLLAFDTNLAPIVGQQVTLTATNAATAAARITLLEQRAAADECDLVVTAVMEGRQAGFLYQPGSNSFARDRANTPALAEAAVRALASSGPVTFTAVPPGSGERIALDRDSNGVLDGD
jgi:DNA-binding beta-propeller fold protein YncE